MARVVKMVTRVIGRLVKKVENDEEMVSNEGDVGTVNTSHKIRRTGTSCLYPHNF